MAFFQNSVLNKHLNGQDAEAVKAAYQKFTAYFHNPAIQQNIRDAKEEQFQEGFLRELFVDILGYTLNPQPNFNLTTELKNEKGAKKADGAILQNGKALGVIELKGTDTKDLDKINVQAFNYKNNQTGCVYVITSNFEKLRFFIHHSVEHLEFNLFTLTETEFQLLWLCLRADNLLNGVPLKVKEESLLEEEKITKQLYKDYATFRNDMWQNMVKNSRAKDKLLLFKKTQKLLDRYLFIFFAEDSGLLPPNSISRIVNRWEVLKQEDAYKPLYDIFKQYFSYIDKGRKGQKTVDDIFAYNGGLFLPDEVLDNIVLDDEMLHPNVMKLTKYDFQSEVDVNILGHIFENSLNEIEHITAEIEGQELDKSKSKRKKDGVFYTPKYITKYIVENTVGKLCEEKKTELGIVDEEYAKGRQNRKKDTVKILDENLQTYRNWLLNITICDPACGSGAFLNQALEFLIEEHTYIDELESQLLGHAFEFPGVENHILEKNIFGVDINDESVDIAKLSLWLRTAQKGRKLTSLNNNIKCGNSLIDDPCVAGEKAFNWQKEFPTVFEKGGFDVIIGNPPYGAYMDNETKQFVSSNFETFQGNYEIYFFFIELVNSLLKRNGKLGFITPDTWINIPQAKKVREHVLKHYGINIIVTYKYTVFEDASVNPIVFILTKQVENSQCEIFHVESKSIDIFYDFSNSQKADIENWRKSDDKQFQIWQDDRDIKIINKIEKKSKRGEDFLDVCQGIVPYSTEHLTKEQIKERIYHSNIKENDEYGIWVQGRAIKRFGIDLSNKEYLKYGNWLHRPRKPKYFNSNRILIQEITGGNPPRISAAIFEEELYHDPGIISCINISKLSDKYLLAVINSTLISWYNLKTSPKGKRTTFPKVLIGDIRKFPIQIPTTNTEKEIAQKVDDIIQKTIEFHKNINQVITLLQSKFEIEKLTTKLQNWYGLEFKDFLKELKKAKVQLSLSEEAEWMQYFNEQKQKAQELKSEINRVDGEIDKMVYQLYGLTEEEIKIVEGGE
ncbi:MAG: N-6 DNA methylase [Vicingaceae bacterium]|nr:MAG: N-6 DNA methylase [Vicingaceae bacterium]